ncbi:MAG: ABC transporter substrate-binding protein [Chloroflexia bacterium]|nr:ABC transporter substrate-binding protein [Chloroflexia bacterium]
MLNRRSQGSRTVSMLLLFAILTAMMPMFGASGQAPLACEPIPRATPAAPVSEPVEIPEVDVPEDAIDITVGYTPISIYAPMFVAKEKGYFAEQGLNVDLQALPGASDMVVLTATGEFDAGIGGIGPAFWNASAQNLPVTIIAPAHGEGSPVATPLMISMDACESGEISSIADLQGMSIGVNAPGATEIWLERALQSGGLTIDDVNVQFLPFPDAVAALDSGAIDASMIGEPLATLAEQNEIAVRLAPDFEVQDFQPTMIFANGDFLADNSEAATGLVAGYLQAARDLNEDFNDPINLAIIEQYTDVPVALVAESIKPVYETDGEIDLESLSALQSFFRERDQLEYDDDIDPATIVDTTFVDDALQRLEDS